MSIVRSDRERDMIALAIAAAPPLTNDQVTKLRTILRPEQWANTSPAVTLRIESQESVILRRAA